LQKTPVEHSEAAKRRESLQRRLANIQRWAPNAHERAQRASALAERLWQETKAHGDALDREIHRSICEYDRGDEREWRLQYKPVVKAMKAEADADLAVRWRRYERVRDRQEREETRYTRSCLEQCDLLRALTELEAKERARILPFFRRPGCVTQGKQTVWVDLRPFNARPLNRDLRVVCERGAAVPPHLPDGRRRCFPSSGTGGVSSDGQPHKVA
jgi:hypothetical protein